MNPKSKNTNSYKVGIKILSDPQLDNILPTHENLFQKFDACRDAAKEELQNSNFNNRKNNYQYNFIYDNIFSILGDRGTGKTSVAFTLREKIQNHENSHYDVVLPLIIPEAIPDNCTVLGWILALIKEEMEKLDNKIKQLIQQSSSSLYWEKCKAGEQTLTEKLEYMSQLFHAGSYNPSNEASYYKAVDNSAVQAEDYYLFSKGIAALWDEWVQRIQEYYKLEQGGNADNICPMIYFIFDDVDLAPDKIKQLLSVIIKYLSHPNIIVLVTANEDLCLEVIETQLDDKIGKLPKEWREYLTLEKNSRFPIWIADEKEPSPADTGLIEQTAKKYLGKVLPTSTRYYLRTFNTAKQKELYYLYDCTLGTAVYQQIKRLLNEMNDKNLQNFMGSEKNLINFYLKYIGNTSRQIANVEVALRELITNMINLIRTVYNPKNNLGTEKLFNKIYQNCRYYIRIAVNTNHELSDIMQQKEEFLDEIFLAEYNQWKNYIDYARLNEFLNETLQDNTIQKKVDIGLQLYSLFAFVENILFMIESAVSETMPSAFIYRRGIHVVPFLTEYIEKTVFGKRHVFQKTLSPNIFFLHYNNLFDRMDIIIKSRMSDRKFNTEYFYNFKYYRYSNSDISPYRLNIMYQKDRQWFQNLVGMLSMVYGNAYLFDSDNMAECLPYLDTNCLPSYKQFIDRTLKNNIIKAFLKPELQTAWSTIKRENNGLFHNYDTNSNMSGTAQKELEEFIAKTASQIQQENTPSQYIPLSRVLERTIEFIESNKDIALKIKWRTFIFSDIPYIEISEKATINFDDYSNTDSLLLEYQGRLSCADSQIGKNAILQNCSDVLTKLEDLIELNPIRRVYIKDICRRIKIETGKKENSSGIISKKLYMDLIQELKHIKSTIKWQNTSSNHIEQIEETNNIIAELLSDIDIGLLISDQNSIQDGVKLAINLFAFELLQSVYIYQTISRRYESNNNLSSKDLEKYRSGGREHQTYYYAVFKKIIEILGGKQKLPIDSGMRYEIESAYMEERQRYVSRLIAEATDE